MLVSSVPYATVSPVWRGSPSSGSSVTITSGYSAGSTALDDASAASIRWNVDKNRDPYIEREAFFACDDDGWHLSWGEDKTFHARRPNRRTLKVTLPLDDLGLEHKKHLRFIALSFVNGTIDGEIHIEETDATAALAPLAGD